MVTDNGSLLMGVNAADPDGDYITYSWYEEGVIEVQGSGPIHAITYWMRPGVGEYQRNITCQVSANERSVDVNWTITFIDINRVPELEYSPHDLYIELDVGDRQEFHVSATDADGDPLNYTWCFDGIPRRSDDPTRFLIISEHGFYGFHDLEVIVNDTHDETSVSWTLDIIDDNKPPKVKRVYPEGDSIHFQHHQPYSIGFLIEATDPDQDPMSYRWYVDDRYVADGSDGNFFFRGDYFSGSSYNISVRVDISDGRLRISHNWTIQLRNREPVIESATPIDTFWMDPSEARVLRLVVEDPDGDELSYCWTVDGEEVTGADLAELALKAKEHSVGPHTINVKITDDSGASVSNGWIFHVNAPSEPSDVDEVTSETPPPWMAVILLGVLLALVVIYIISNRRT